MYEIIPIKIIYHGEFKKERQVSVRIKKSDFPSLESLKKYIKNVVINNYSRFTVAEKVEVSMPVNSDLIERILKLKANKLEVVEQIVVDVHW